MVHALVPGGNRSGGDNAVCFDAIHGIKMKLTTPLAARSVSMAALKRVRDGVA